MTLIERIKADQLAARKAKDLIKAPLLVTLYAEAEMKGKNDGNRAPTDDEVTSTIRKFLKGVNETILALQNSNDSRLNIAIAEKHALESYLPQMASKTDVAVAIEAAIASGKTKKGDIMKALKDKFGAQLDGKLASSLIKDK